MANKTLGTRQKMVFRLPQSGAPRNPLVALAKQRKAGPHEKGKGALRRQSNVLLGKLLREVGEEQ